MKTAILILIVLTALFDYSLFVMASGADRQAEEMYQRYKERHDGREGE